MQGMGGGRFGCLCLPRLPPPSPGPPPILLSIQVSNHQPADFPHNVTTIKFSNLQGTNNFCYNDIEKTTFYFVKANYDIDRHRKGVG